MICEIARGEKGASDDHTWLGTFVVDKKTDGNATRIHAQIGKRAL